MTGPERYTFMDPDQYADLHGEGGPVITEPGWSGKAVEYVRLDLYTAQQETIAALVEALEEAKRELEEVTTIYMGEDYNSPSLNAALARAKESQG